MSIQRKICIIVKSEVHALFWRVSILLCSVPFFLRIVNAWSRRSIVYRGYEYVAESFQYYAAILESAILILITFLYVIFGVKVNKDKKK